MTDRPALEAVLDYYEVEFNTDRPRQMLSCPLDLHPRGDRTPSMSINLEKQVFHCFACGEGGSSFDLIMKMETCDFRQAVKFATTKSFSTRDAGGGDEDVRGSSFGRGVRRPAGKGAKPRNGGYRPSWRRG